MPPSSAERVVVGPEAVSLNSMDAQAGARIQSVGCRINLLNAGPKSVFLGGVSVSGATGYELKADEPIGQIQLQPGDVLYAVTADRDTSTLHVLRT
jgi:hypothetical protein